MNVDGSLKDPCTILAGSEFSYVSATGRTSLGTVDAKASQNETRITCRAKIKGGNAGTAVLRLSFGTFQEGIGGDPEIRGYKCQDFSDQESAFLACGIGEANQDVWILFNDGFGATSTTDDLPALRTMMEQILKLLAV